VIQVVFGILARVVAVIVVMVLLMLVKSANLVLSHIVNVLI